MNSDNQSIPVIISRDKQIPLQFVKHDRKLDWDDLPEHGAITNKEMDAILFKDQENIICLLKGSGNRARRVVDGSMTKEWIHNYSIMYIDTATEMVKDVREKSIYNLGRIREEGTNMKRYPNNVNDFSIAAIQVYFPERLNHTRKEEDPSLRYLFELRFGKKRSLTPVNTL